MLLIVLVQQMEDDAVHERRSGIFPKRILAPSFACLHHHLRNRRYVRELFKRLEVNLGEGIPFRCRSILAERFELHDALMQMMLAPAGREIPELSLWVEKEDTVLPADAGRHHIANALAASRRCNEQDMFRAIMEHEFVVERIPAYNKAGLFR